MTIHISNLKKSYRGVTVLDIEELTIESGELVGLVGNNGAGKTTMMRLILDLIQANDGYVDIDGKRVGVYVNWKSATGSYLDSSFLIDFYTPEEYFAFVAEAYDIPEEEMKARLEKYSVLMDGEILGKGKLLKEFSNGNRQKIGIIGAMLINPQLLILDEPFNYLDPSSQIEVARLISQMNQEDGTTVLVSSHNLASINDICSRILLLHRGKLMMDLNHTPGETDADLEAYFERNNKWEEDAQS